MRNKSNKIILGIESSCDETSAAIIEAKSYLPASEAGNLKAINFRVLSNIVLSQINIHKKYGGVVPEVAARNHIVNIIPVIDQALTEAKTKPAQIDLIAVTTGPGLITSLMVGIETAKTLAYAWQKPLVAVNHLKAHIYAAWLPSSVPTLTKGGIGGVIQFPLLALVVSGGHTELVLMKNNRSFKKIGQTVDDAAGEAFDKVAKILGLGYPGGPIISKMAETGNSQAFKMPRPMIDSPDFNFSFSGLKTAVLYAAQKINNPPNSPLTKGGEESGWTKNRKADLAASFQQAAVDVLVHKTIKAALKNKVKSIIIGGGVAANKKLRESLTMEAMNKKLHLIIPEIRLCTDNAAPIAVAGYFEKPIDFRKIIVNPNLEI